MNPSAGKADPFWYEWNVGLEKVIEMLQPDTDIASVEFQRDGIKGWDDVVVRFTDGTTHYLQVKHSRVGTNLTFGSLVTVDEGVSLLGSLFDAWKQLGAGRAKGRFFLFTNREAGSRASKSDSGVARPPLTQFVEWLGEALKAHGTIAAIVPITGWEAAWREWLDQLKGTEEEQYDFLSALVIDTSREDSPQFEELLIGMLQKSFATSPELAAGLFQGLTNALRQWTTSRFNRPVELEDVLQALSLSADAPTDDAAPPPPAPFFASRQNFIEAITAALTTGPKVVFLCGEPGAGKTSLVSSLAMRRTERAMTGLVGLRYFAYRPITVESPVIPADADKYVQPERLWYSFLSQLRRGLRGRLRHHRVPVHNRLISWTEARDHVLRIADELGREMDRDFVIVVDGIDHAARASRYDPTASKGFFNSLPGPDDLTTRRVRLLVAGQPPAAYPEYPLWLSVSRADVKRLEVGKLDDGDIRMLLNTVNPVLVAAAGEAVVRLVRDQTDGNTLATVFAADESRHCATVGELQSRLEQRKLKDGLIQYYQGIWAHATGGNPGWALPLASLFFVARERVTPRILAAAFPGLGGTELSWQQTLDALEPLMIADPDGYRVRHNDVRVFLHSVLEVASKAARQAAMGMTFDYYKAVAPNRLAAHRCALHLAKESGRLLDWAALYSVHWVFEAAALGLTYLEIQEECVVALEQAAIRRDWAVMLQVACAAETLEAWEDRCMGGWFEGQKPSAEREAPFLRSEGAVTPVERWTITELHEVLNDAAALLASGIRDRGRDLLARWFGGMTLSQLLGIVGGLKDDSPAGFGERDSRPELAERLGRTFRSALLVLPEGEKPSKKAEKKTLSLLFRYELGWVAASTARPNGKNLTEAYAGRQPGFYGTIEKAVVNLAEAGDWSLVREALGDVPKDHTHFTKSFLVRAAWRSLRAGCGLQGNVWLDILQQPRFGLEGLDDEQVPSGIDVARALGWTKVAADTGAIGRDVYQALNPGIELTEAPLFVALYRAAALLGRIASVVETKGREVAGELVPAKEVRQVAEALWSERMHEGMRPFDHRKTAGSIALELVNVAVGLSGAHRDALLDAAAAVPKFRMDDRRGSLWELYRRTGRKAELKAWLDRWLGNDGWLWTPDTGSRESTLDELLPLAREIGESDLAEKSRQRASWLRITYRGSKDHSFRPLHQWLKALGEIEPTCWRDLGVYVLTVYHAAREAGCDNEYGSEIQELVGVLAYRSGADDYRRLLLVDEPARDGEDRYYNLRNRTMNGAVEFVRTSSTMSEDDAVAIWCLVLGWTRWHESHTVNRLHNLREALLAHAGSEAQRSRLINRLEKISSTETTREAPPDEDSGAPKYAPQLDTRSAMDFVKEVEGGNTLRPSAALIVVKHLQLTRPANFDDLIARTLAQVGPTSPYGGTWHYDDRQSSEALQEIAELVTEEQLWSLVGAVNHGVGRGSAWLQSVTDNLFEVLLARADAQGAEELRSGVMAMCDMHERWLRGGNKTEEISTVTLPPAATPTTWADTVETSLEILLGSHSAEVVASGLRAAHAWITARPERIQHLFGRLGGQDWKANWLLTLTERWATEYPEEVEKVRAELEAMASSRLLHLRLQAWLNLLMLAMAEGKELPDFPDNPAYQRKRGVPLTMPPKEILETKHKKVGSSNFVDRFGSANSTLTRVAVALGCELTDIKRQVAQAVLELPDPNKPTTFPEYLYGDGDVFCPHVDVLEAAMSAPFEQKLADQPLTSTAVMKLAHGYLHAEDAWIVSESPRPTRAPAAWPDEKLLNPGYQVPTDRNTLEKICHQLALISEVCDDEIVIAAKISIYRNDEDFEYLCWYQESDASAVVVSAPKPATTISARTFPWRTEAWYEQRIRRGNRPLVHFAGALNLLHNSGVPIVPAVMWSTEFGWSPSLTNPLEWTAEEQIVARFERIHGPLRSIRRGHFRQPLLERWLVKKLAWRVIVTKLAPLRIIKTLDSYWSDAEP